MSPFLAACADHLCQSTAFAAFAAFLVWVLRRDRARLRYAVWLAVSLKFLFPFSLLIALGNRFALSIAPVSGGFSLLQETGRPFTSHLREPAPPFTHPGAVPVTLVLFSLWLSGFCTIIFRWALRWFRLRAIACSAERLDAHRIASANKLDVRACHSTVEPGVFGIFRPVLLLPAGLAAHLTPQQLESVLAHEVCHVRRRDNLTAALHMLVEAVFWFHPLVWWLQARLLEERELACDEEVLLGGREPQSYAETLLTACRYCLESPLACASGIGGSNLSRGIERIVAGNPRQELGTPRKLLLVSSALAAVCIPVIIGLATPRLVLSQSQSPSKSALAFDAASIKLANPGARGRGLVVDPGRLRLMNLTLRECIAAAYGMADFRISSPAALPSTRYDVVATAPSHRGREFDQPLQLMLQNLLAERFHLAVHRDQKVMSHYALVAAKGGAKLKSSDQPGYSTRSSPGSLQAWGLSMDDFAGYLTRRLDRPVVDATGIAGRYDLTLNWSPDETQSNPEMPNPNQPPPAADDTRPSIFKALEEQLGLKLEGRKGPVEILVVERADPATPN